MKQTPAATYNLVTIVFGALTVFSCLCIGGLLILRPAALGKRVVVVPTSIVAPTDTPTFTPSATYTPSATATPTDSPTATDTNTPVATATLFPSATPLVIAVPPTIPPLPTAQVITNPTPIVVAGGTPFKTTVPLNLIYRAASVVPAYSANPDPTTGCSVAAIAGQIFGLNGKPVTTGVAVFIAGPAGFKKLAYPSAINKAPFGVGFWLLVITGNANRNAYTVEVIDAKQLQVSLPVTVQFTGDCQQNVALINFQQNLGTLTQ